MTGTSLSRGSRVISNNKEIKNIETKVPYQHGNGDIRGRMRGTRVTARRSKMRGERGGKKV